MYSFDDIKAAVTRLAALHAQFVQAEPDAAEPGETHPSRELLNICGILRDPLAQDDRKRFDLVMETIIEKKLQRWWSEGPTHPTHSLASPSELPTEVTGQLLYVLDQLSKALWLAEDGNGEVAQDSITAVYDNAVEILTNQLGLDIHISGGSAPEAAPS